MILELILQSFPDSTVNTTLLHLYIHFRMVTVSSLYRNPVLDKMLTEDEINTTFILGKNFPFWNVIYDTTG